MPTGWEKLFQDYNIKIVPVANKLYDTCDGCAFAHSIICMGAGDCTGTIFMLYCDD